MGSDSGNSASYTPSMCFSHFRSIPVSCSWLHFLLLSEEFCSINYLFYLLYPQPFLFHWLPPLSLETCSTLSILKKIKTKRLSLDPEPHFGYCLYQSAQNAITKYNRLGGLRNRNIFSHNSGSWKSKIRVPAGLGSGESPLSGGLQWLPSLCVLAWQREIPLLIRPLIP